jgi:hypothetical protein
MDRRVRPGLTGVLETAKALGLAIPAALLRSADQGVD